MDVKKIYCEGVGDNNGFFEVTSTQPLTATEIQRRWEEDWPKMVEASAPAMDKALDEFLAPMVDRLLEILKEHNIK